MTCSTCYYCTATSRTVPVGRTVLVIVGTVTRMAVGRALGNLGRERAVSEAFAALWLGDLEDSLQALVEMLRWAEGGRGGSGSLG
jgi:hypothetical protein